MRLGSGALLPAVDSASRPLGSRASGAAPPCSALTWQLQPEPSQPLASPPVVACPSDGAGANDSATKRHGHARVATVRRRDRPAATRHDHAARGDDRRPASAQSNRRPAPPLRVTAVERSSRAGANTTDTDPSCTAAAAAPHAQRRQRERALERGGGAGGQAAAAALAAAREDYAEARREERAERLELDRLVEELRPVARPPAGAHPTAHTRPSSMAALSGGSKRERTTSSAACAHASSTTVSRAAPRQIDRVSGGAPRAVRGTFLHPPRIPR